MNGGFTYGATDDLGFVPVENAMHMHDFHATLLHALGLDHKRFTFRHAGRDFICMRPKPWTAAAHCRFHFSSLLLVLRRSVTSHVLRTKVSIAGRELFGDLRSGAFGAVTDWPQHGTTGAILGELKGLLSQVKPRKAFIGRA